MRSCSHGCLFAAVAVLLAGLALAAPAVATVSSGPSYYSADDMSDSYGGPGVTWTGTPEYGLGHTDTAGDRAFVTGPSGALTVNDPAVGNFGTGDFTLHLFARLAAGGGPNQDLLSKRADCAGGSFLDLRAGTRFGGVYLQLHDGEKYAFNVVNQVGIVDNAWHEITVTRARNLVSLTVDRATTRMSTNGVVDLDTTAAIRFGDGPCVSGPGGAGDGTTRAVGRLDEISFGPGTAIVGSPVPRPPVPRPLLPAPPLPASDGPSVTAAVPTSRVAVPVPVMRTPTAPFTSPSPSRMAPQRTPRTSPGVPTSGATETSSPARQPDRHAAAQAGGGGVDHRGEAGVAFTRSVPGPSEVSTRVLVLVRNAMLAILLLTLLALPINIVNATAKENVHRLAAVVARTRWLRLPFVVAVDRLPLIVGLGLIAAVSAVAYGFVEPSFGWDLSSLALVLGLTAAFLIVSIAKHLSRSIYLRRTYDIRGFLRLFPAFVLVGVSCVVVSRVVGLHPGLILGTLATLGVRGKLAAEQRGRAIAVSAGALTVVGLLAWILRSPIVGAAGPAGGFLPTVLGVALSGVVVAAAENLAFGLLPLSFLDGAPLFAWSKPVWAAFSALGAFAFVHVLLQRSAGPFTDRVTYLLVLLGIYFTVAVSFWAWFRFRPTGEHASTSPAARNESTSLRGGE